MKANKLTILIVDDEKGYRQEISEYLLDSGFAVFTAEAPSVALSLLEKETIDIAILDLRLPEMNGLDLMKKIHEKDSDIGVIIISGHGDMDSVISAMRDGAIDFFPKPFNLVDIRFAIERTRKYLELSDKLTDIKDTYDNLLEHFNREFCPPMIGDSQVMQQILLQMKQVSSNLFTDVLITGESGTGKELVARGIHCLGAGVSKVFFDVNCTAIPETLFESEFFGHTRNAFTGAQAEKKGWFEMANGGTLFLDEIGDLPLSMQAKLLRVLEERKIRRVGSNVEIPLKLRIIASTNKNLKVLMEQKLFREDLYYRLNRFPIYLPPLRERKNDIPALTKHFHKVFSDTIKKPIRECSEKTISALLEYSFPGNIRELRNMIEKAIILSSPTDKFISINHFSELQSVIESDTLNMQSNNLDLNSLEALEQNMIIKAMKQAAYNKTKAAELLNITRTSLNRRILKYNLKFE